MSDVDAGLLSVGRSAAGRGFLEALGEGLTLGGVFPVLDASLAELPHELGVFLDEIELLFGLEGAEFGAFGATLGPEGPLGGVCSLGLLVLEGRDGLLGEVAVLTRFLEGQVALDLGDAQVAIRSAQLLALGEGVRVGGVQGDQDGEQGGSDESHDTPGLMGRSGFWSKAG